MNLSQEDISILILLIEDKLDENYSHIELVSPFWKPEILQAILKKLQLLSNNTQRGRTIL